MNETQKKALSIALSVIPEEQVLNELVNRAAAPQLKEALYQKMPEVIGAFGASSVVDVFYDSAAGQLNKEFIDAVVAKAGGITNMFPTDVNTLLTIAKTAIVKSEKRGEIVAMAIAAIEALGTEENFS